MAWVLLVGAIVLEVAGTTCMKLSDGFREPAPTAGIFLFYAASMGLLTLAIRQIDLSVAYAVWSGLGTALVAAIGLFAFHEPLTALRLVFLALIVTGVAGLELSAGGAG